MGEHRQTGLVACASVDEYDKDVIKKHEKTRPDKEDDRVRHIDGFRRTTSRCSSRTGPSPRSTAPSMVKRAAPTYDLVTPDGVGHQLWVVAAAGDAIGALFRLRAGALRGRWTSPLRRRIARPRTSRGKPGEHGVFPTVVFPHDQVQILAYNRLVRDPAGRGPEALLAALREVFDVEPAASARPDQPLTFGVFVGGRWWRARVRPGSFDARDPVASLDCSIVQEKLLAPLFGIVDIRTSKDVDFVGGIRGAEELERRVKEERWSLALHLFPTSVDQLIAVSDAGKLMPPKSTWFEPKLRSGLFVHAF